MKKSNGCVEVFGILFLIGLVITYWPVLIVVILILIVLMMNRRKKVNKFENDYKQMLIRHEKKKVEFEEERKRIDMEFEEKYRLKEEAIATFEREISKYEKAIDKIIEEENMRDICNTNFDSMSGLDFEEYCANLLQENGFESAETTKASGDQGIDVLAVKEGIKYAVQCKCYSSDIGNKAVQEVYAGKSFYNCHVAVVLTNRFFTPSAIELAATNGVVLWDRDKLIEMSKVFPDTGYSYTTDEYGYNEYTCTWTIDDNSEQILSELERLDKKMDELTIAAQRFIDVPESNSFRARMKFYELLDPYWGKYSAVHTVVLECEDKEAKLAHTRMCHVVRDKHKNIVNIIEVIPKPLEYIRDLEHSIL